MPRRTASGLDEVVVALLAPGVPTLLRRRWLGVLLLVVGLLAPIAWLVVAVLRHKSWITLGLDRRFLLELMAAIGVAGAARVVAIAEVLVARRRGPRRPGRLALAALCLVAIVVPGAYGVSAAVSARDDIARAFEHGTDEPLFVAASADAAPTDSVAPGSTVVTVPHDPIAPLPPEQGIPSTPGDAPAPDSGVDPALLADVTTVLLLGGDAGPGRSGLRTDSMILVSIHRPSGRTALISVPRDLERLRFPPGSALHERYPQGFNDIANAVYPRVSSNEGLRNAYTVGELRPGAVAIAQGIGYSLDLTIDDYVLVDMQGFLEVIDALGGVTVDVPKAVPTPGNPPGAKHPVPLMIEAGVQHMTGTTALAYVRSRKADSDYQRMRRQRQVLSALAGQISVGDALSGYRAVADALGESLRTSLTVDEFANLLDVLGGDTAIAESVGLAPPLISPARPDFDAIAKLVGRVQLAIVNGQPSGL